MPNLALNLAYKTLAYLAAAAAAAAHAGIHRAAQLVNI